MKNKTLCLKLMRCETEPDLIKTLKKAGLWNNNQDWVNYGGMENNFSIIGNQQSSPETALVEKLINSIDAVLIGETLKRGIHPESPEAPSTIKDAVNQYFNVYGGSLKNIDSSQRTKLSQYVSLVATGKKGRPTYTIIDRGEGQYPEDFHETFLSLAKSNKIKIPFVQGKFNMGGSGVLQFCGKHNLQLIVSRKNHDISTGSDWGFTVVRRQSPKDGYKSSSYTYLAPKGEIMSFPYDKPLPVTPQDYPSAYGCHLESGTFIKLFDYNMKGGLKTNINFDLYYKMNLLLPDLALPVRLYERRKGYKGHSMESSLSGLQVRLSDDRGDNLEDGFPSSFTFDGFRADLYVFKPKAHRNFISGEGILFTTNGQTQGVLQKSFFNRNAVGMGSLADSIVIIVNCDNIDPQKREDLFMNSRDRLRYGDVRSEVENQLERYVSEHEGLKQLRKARRNSQIKDDMEDQAPFQDMMKDIIRESSTLSSLFFGGKQIKNPFKVLQGKEVETFEGKRFPEFLLLDIHGEKTAYIGERFRIQYTTDAQNDYLTRENEPGQYYLYHRKDLLDVSVNLWNGFLNVNVELPKNTKVGDTLDLRSELWDNNYFEPFEHKFTVNIAEKRPKSSGKGNTRKNPTSPDKGNHSPFKDENTLPNIVEVKKDSWYKYEFGKNDCLKIINNGELGFDFVINMDNQYLLSELIKNEDDIPLIRLKYKYVVSIIGMAILREQMQEQAQHITKMLAPVILPISTLNLNKISI